jgi:hypothetical protein
MQNGKHRPVALRIEIVERLPRSTGRAGFGLTIAHDSHDEKIRTIERGPKSVKKAVAEFSSLMDGSRNMRPHVAGHTPGCREFTTETAQPLPVALHFRADVAVTALEPDVGQNSGRSVPRPGDEQGTSLPASGDSKELGVEEVESGAGAPVSEKSRLDVFRTKRLPEKDVVEKKNLTCGEIVCGSPPERLPGRVTP